MAYIGEVGKRITVKATYKKCFERTDYKFSYYGTTHYTHIFEDSEGNTIVWKSTNLVEYIENNECKFVTEGSVVLGCENRKYQMECCDILYLLPILSNSNFRECIITKDNNSYQSMLDILSKVWTLVYSEASDYEIKVRNELSTLFCILNRFQKNIKDMGDKIKSDDWCCWYFSIPNVSQSYSKIRFRS